jgi:hypothetical protein
MSDDSQNSLWMNLTNKIKYNVFKATYDPDANQYAQKQQQVTQTQDIKKEEITSSTDTSTSEDPNKFSVGRLMKKTAKQSMATIMKGLIPFLALMIAMIITNEMIVYSAPIRIIFFIFVFVICLFPPVTAILGIFYILKGGYSYYVNNMTNRPKQDIMPTIYALLPITTTKPMSSLSSFLMYPFTYPKTELAAEQLPKTMTQYFEDLKSSFMNFDTYKTLPQFVEGIKKVESDLAKMHSEKDTINNTTQE